MKMKKFLKKFTISLIGRPNFIRKIQWIVLEQLIKKTRKGTFLDIGAGSLYFTEKLNSFNPKKIIAIDIDFDEQTIKNAEKMKILTIEADAQKELPLEEGIADLIILSSIIQMVANPDDLLKECKRLLKSDGLIIISAPNEYKFLPKLHKFFSNYKFLNIFNIPKIYEDYLESLRNNFGAIYKHGFFSEKELLDLIQKSGFQVTSKKTSPGFFGSFLWEISLIFQNRFGKKVFYFLYLFTPIAIIFDYLYNSNYSCEHIWGIQKSDLIK